MIENLERYLDIGGNWQIQFLKDYIVKNASEVLAEKIVKSGKNLRDCWLFIGQTILSQGLYQKFGNIGVEDPTKVTEEWICGQAMHYFEEDSIKVQTKLEKPAAAPKPKQEPKVQAKTSTEIDEKRKKEIEEQAIAEFKKAQAEEKAKLAAAKKKEKEEKKKTQEPTGQVSLFDFM